MAQYLDKTGLETYDGKIKEYITAKIPTKTSQLTNNSGFLTSVKLPFDTWDGYGKSGELVLPSGGWYYIFQLPGSGILYQVENNYTTKAQIFEIDTTADTIRTVETVYNSSAKTLTLVSKDKSTSGWTQNASYFYYKKIG